MKTNFIIFRYLAIIALIISGLSASSQQLTGVSVQLIIPPPFSPRIADYSQNDASRVRILINNSTGEQLRIKLVGELRGRNNAIRAYTKANYQPIDPIILEPRSTVTLDANNGNNQNYFDKSNVEYTGLDEGTKAQALATGLIPEGVYDLCVYALPFVAQVQIENNTPKGCVVIPITYIEPPRLVAPQCDKRVYVPDNIQFVWTPPIGNIMGAQLEYDFYLVKVPEGQNPNDAIDNAINRNVGNPFVQKDLTSIAYNYSQADPKLEDGLYVWRVIARDARPEDQKSYFQNDGKSEFCTFRIGEPPVDVREVAGITKCKDAPAVVDKTPVTSSPSGQTIKLGKFDLTVVNSIKRANGAWSGTGKIAWNGVPIKVIFSGLTFNAANEAITGYAEGDRDLPGFPDVDFTSINAMEAIQPDFYANYAKALKDRLINDLKGAAAVPLPIGYDAGAGLIGINYMKFSEQGADMGLLLNIELPEANSFLSLAAIDICMAPDRKLPQNANLFLLKNLKVPGLPITFIKSDYPQPNGTFAEISTEKVERIHGVMELNLGADAFKLVDNNGDEKAGDVKATLTADFLKWTDWVASVQLPNFTLAVLPGFNLKGVELFYDHSDFRNPEGFNPPQQYTGERGNTFNGLFFKKLDVLLPKSISGGNGRLSFSVQQAIINGNGFTGLLKPVTTPLLSYGVGSMGSWGFSIEDFQILIVQNRFEEGSMNGRLQFPISTDYLTYTCTLRDKFDNIQFVVAPGQNGYNVPLMAANMKLYNNSHFIVGYNAGNPLIDLILNGEVTINAPAPLTMVLPNLFFQGFAVSNQRQAGRIGSGNVPVYLTPGQWKLLGGVFKDAGGKGGGILDEEGEFTPAPADGESGGTLAGFPIEILPPVFVSNNNGIGMELGVKVNVGGDDKTIVGAEGAVQILGGLTMTNGRPVPKFNGIYPTRFSIEGDMGPLQIKGQLKLFYNNPQFGTGFNGYIEVVLASLLKAQAEVMFGKSSFYYAYVDASVMFSPGLVIAPPVPLTLNGFGGGIYFNMRMDGNPVENVANNPAVGDPNDPDVTHSGLRYIPQQGSWGIKARVFLGLADPHIFASSLELEAGFADGALVNFRLEGKAGIINPSGLPSDPNAMVSARVLFAYQAPATYDIAMDVTAKLLIQVNIPFRMHFDPNAWHIKLGDPYGKRASVTLLDFDAGIVKAFLGAECYLAMGNDLGGLPPLPKIVADFLSMDGSSEGAANAQRNAQAQRSGRSIPNIAGGNFAPAPITASFALLMGANVRGSVGIDLALIKFEVNAIVGFDAALMFGLQCANGTQPKGFNGMYASMQFYAYVGGKVILDLGFVDFTLASLEAGAVLRGGGPDPFWGEGAVRVRGEVLGFIKVDVRAGFKFGEPEKKCIPSFAGDPTVNLILISDLYPADKEKEVATRSPLTAVFNVPIDVPFVLEIPDGSFRTYIFRVEKYAVTYLDKEKGNQVTPFTALEAIEWQNDNYQFTLDKQKHFPSESEITFYVRARIRQIEGNGDLDPYIDKNKRREPRIQEKSTTFISGKQPDYIPLEDVRFTYPIDRQRYFFKNQVPQGIVNGQIPDEIFKQKNPSTVIAKALGSFVFEAHWISEDGGEPLITTVNYDNASSVTFGIPVVQAEKKYRVELRKIYRSNLNTLASASFVNSSRSVISQNFVGGSNDYFKIRDNKLDQNTLREGTKESPNRVIFDIACRTSKFNTFQDKMAAISFPSASYNDGSAYYSDDTYHTFDLIPEGNVENFEDFEYQGYPAPNGKVYNSPLLTLGTPFNKGTSYDDYILAEVYNPLFDLAILRTPMSFYYQQWREAQDFAIGLPKRALEIKRYRSDIAAALATSNSSIAGMVANAGGNAQSNLYAGGALSMTQAGTFTNINAAVTPMSNAGTGGTSSTSNMISESVAKALNTPSFALRLLNIAVNDEPLSPYKFRYQRDHLAHHDYNGLRLFMQSVWLKRDAALWSWQNGYWFYNYSVAASKETKSMSVYNTYDGIASFYSNAFIDSYKAKTYSAQINGSYTQTQFILNDRTQGSKGEIELSYQPYPTASKVTLRKQFQFGTGRLDNASQTIKTDITTIPYYKYK